MFVSSALQSYTFCHMRSSRVRQQIEGIGGIDLADDLARANDGKLDGLEEFMKNDIPNTEFTIQEKHFLFLTSLYEDI
jgi:hypothetical protein